MSSITDNLKTTQKKWTDTIKPKNPEMQNPEVQKSENTENNDDKANDIVLKLTEENASLKDKLLRTLAEIENIRRISEEEKQKTIKFAITSISKDLIGIMENFYRSFDNVNKDDIDNFIKGVELNFNEFKKIFEKNNIVRIYPLNEKFDPNLHEAISQIESDKESGTIIEVLQSGYTLNDRVIKPALVVVAK